MLCIKTQALPRGTRRAFRWIGWNAFLLSVGLALVVGVAEAWLRVTTPFMHSIVPRYFHPRAGLILKPNAEIRWTNGLDYWTTSRTNSLGFLDRAPPPERTAASCHVTMIGDSFVEAKEVSIAEKVHVRLEDLASRRLPHLNIITSAFGRRNTGQINQLPYYDEFARHLHPRLVVLVFVRNDFENNSPILTALRLGVDPDHSPFVTAVREENGLLTLRPPDPDYQRFRLTRRYGPWTTAVQNWGNQKLYFVPWLRAEASVARILWRINRLLSIHRFRLVRAELLSRYPAYVTLIEGWTPTTPDPLDETPYGKTLPPVFEEAVEFTAFALDQFKARAGRDGGSLVILSTHEMETRGSSMFDWLSAMADARGIPIINQYDYILRQGTEVADAHWAHDGHWNPIGHRWAAEALLEYLKQHPEICEDRRTGERHVPE